jgi:DNA-binding beta-propeller fold protein YncE
MSVGTQIAGYRLEKQVGRGGMGVVYRAHDVALERSVALKLLAPALADDPAFRERFLVESRLAASLDHPNVIPIHDAGEMEGQLYLAMRYVEGTDLKRLLTEKGPLEPARAIAICAQVASALDAAHARGLVHRDVKPSNVLLDEEEHAYLADFGLTRRLSDQAPGFEAGLSLGTPAYVAPEQIEGKDVDGRADQYSLACLLTECLTGRPPFDRTSEAATLFAHLEEKPPAPEGLESVVPKALAKDPADRYESCAAFVTDARRMLGLEPKRVRWPLAIAGVGAALVGAALLAFFLTRGGDPVAPVQAGRLLRIDPASNSVASSAAVGEGASAVATDGRRVWVASYQDGTLWRGEIGSGGMTKVPAFGRPYAVTMHDGSAYVAALGPGQFDGNISTFDAVTGGRRGGLNLFACALASSPTSVWAAGCPNVQELETESSGDLRVKETVVIPYHDPLVAGNFREALSGMAIAAGAIWVIGDPADRRLWRIDPGRHRITATVELGFPPGGVAVGGGAVWITDMLGDRLVRVDPATNRMVAIIPVGRGAHRVAFGAGSVWVANAIEHTVTRVDPRTNRVVATIPVAASPQAVASGGGSLWVVGDAR